jgi:hypothetical protein
VGYRTTPHPNSPRVKAERLRAAGFAASGLQISTPPNRIMGAPKRPRGGYRLADR